MGNEEKKVVKVKTVKVKPKEAPAPEPVKVEVPAEPVKTEPVAEKATAPFYKKWWFWLIVAAAAIAVFALLSNGSNKSTDPAERVYVAEDKILEMYSDPKAYKGQYVKLSGKVFSNPEQKDGTYVFQMWGDPTNSERNTIVYTSDTTLDLHEGDYVMVDGRIDGVFSGENMLGGEVTAPQIGDAVVTKSNYVDVVVPTLKEITPNLNQDQQGFNVTVEKIQYAAEQTRVYVTIRNNSADKMSFSNYDTRILMNGQQIEQKDDWDAELPKLSYEILPGASTSGVLTFPAIDQNQAFQLIIPSIYSDNWELDYEFKDMVFDIQP